MCAACSTVLTLPFSDWLAPCCSTGQGSAPQGNIYAQATTTSSYVGSGGNTAISQNVPIDLTAPTQQWDIGGCISFT